MRHASDADLQVRWARGWSAFMALGMLAVGIASAAIALNSFESQPVAAWSAAGLALVFTLGFGQSARMLVRPPLMFVVDASGIRTHLSGHRYGPQSYVLPWSRVRSIELVKRATGSSQRLWTIAVTATPGEAIPHEVSAGGSDDSLVLHLDANTGTLRREQLLHAILDLWRRHGGA